MHIATHQKSAEHRYEYNIIKWIHELLVIIFKTDQNLPPCYWKFFNFWPFTLVKKFCATRLRIFSF